MRGSLPFTRKLITKGLTTGSEKDGEFEERIIVKNNEIFATEDDTWLLQFDPFNRQSTFWSKATFPILGDTNQYTSDQIIKIEGGIDPGITTHERISIDGLSYLESFLGSNRLYLDYQGEGYTYNGIFIRSNRNGCLIFASEYDAEGKTKYDFSVYRGEIGIYNSDYDLIFGTTLAGTTNTFLEYQVKGIRVLGEQQPAIPDPALNVADNSILNLPIGANYSQTEVQALRSQVEALRDALESTRSQLIAVLGTMRAHGLIALDQG